MVRPFVQRVAQAIESAKYVGESKFDEAAAERWEDFYAELAAGPGSGWLGP